MGSDRFLHYSKIATGETGQDEKGKYEIYRVSEESYCDCHPETCCHFDSKKMYHYDKKIYIK